MKRSVLTIRGVNDYWELGSHFATAGEYHQSQLWTKGDITDLGDRRFTFSIQGSSAGRSSCTWMMKANSKAHQVWYASCVLYNGVLWIVKFAFLALYWNLFERVQGGLRWVLPGAVIVTVAAFLVQLISFFAWCRPISNNW